MNRVNDAINLQQDITRDQKSVDTRNHVVHENATEGHKSEDASELAHQDEDDEEKEKQKRERQALEEYLLRRRRRASSR